MVRCEALGRYLRARTFQVVDCLEVHPILRRGAESLAEPDRHLRADRALAIHDPRDGIVLHMDMVGEFPGAQAKRFEFVGGSCRGGSGEGYRPDRP